MKRNIPKLYTIKEINKTLKEKNTDTEKLKFLRIRTTTCFKKLFALHKNHSLDTTIKSIFNPTSKSATSIKLQKDSKLLLKSIMFMQQKRIIISNSVYNRIPWNGSYNQLKTLFILLLKEKYLRRIKKSTFINVFELNDIEKNESTRYTKVIWHSKIVNLLYLFYLLQQEGLISIDINLWDKVSRSFKVKKKESNVRFTKEKLIKLFSNISPKLGKKEPRDYETIQIIVKQIKKASSTLTTLTAFPI